MDENSEVQREEKLELKLGASELITFRTRRGYILKVRAVSGWLVNDKLGEMSEPEVPTYDVETKAGVQTFRHYHDPNKPDKSTLRTDEDKAAWEKYQEDQTAYYLERNEKLLQLYISEAIVDPPMPTDEWKQRMARLKVEIPEDEDELLTYFYEREVFGSQSDVVEFMLAVMQAGGDVSDERIATIAASFRRTLSRLTDVALDNTEGRLELQPYSGEGESSPLVGIQEREGIREAGPDGSGDQLGSLPDGDGDAGV